MQRAPPPSPHTINKQIFLALLYVMYILALSSCVIFVRAKVEYLSEYMRDFNMTQRQKTEMKRHFNFKLSFNSVSRVLFLFFCIAFALARSLAFEKQVPPPPPPVNVPTQTNGKAGAFHCRGQQHLAYNERYSERAGAGGGRGGEYQGAMQCICAVSGVHQTFAGEYFG